MRLATKSGSLQIVKMLRTCKPYLLHQALVRNVKEQETVEILLENGADANRWCKDGYMPIHIAAQSGSLRNMQLLIKFGANVNARRKNGWWLAIHYAIYKKRTHIVRFLIEKGSDVNASRVCKIPIYFQYRYSVFVGIEFTIPVLIPVSIFYL